MTENASTHDFTNDLAVLQQDYLKRLRGHLSELRRSYELLSNGVLPLKDLQQLYRLSNNFYGSGTTFGFPAISNAAFNLHETLKKFLEGKDVHQNALSPDRQAVLKQLKVFNDICREAANKSASTPVREWAVSSVGYSNSRILGILAYRNPAAQQLMTQLKEYGYSVIAVKDAIELNQLRANTDFHALIFFDDMSTAEMAQLEVVLAENKEKTIPYLFITANDYTASHLSASRLKMAGVFPVDVDILDLLDKVEEGHYNEPAHKNVLIIDSNDMMAEFYSHMLKSQGLKTTKLLNIKELPRVLLDHYYHLIILDRGAGNHEAELVNLIRQGARYSLTPVILIADDDSGKSSENTDIDDYLVKPFTPDQLGNVVQRRLKRHDMFLQVLQTDHVTLLLTQKSFIEQMNYFKSEGERFALASFTVNGSVSQLRSLGHALRAHIRQDDRAGRIADQTIGALLVNCDSEKARKIAEAVTADFARLHPQIALTVHVENGQSIQTIDDLLVGR